MGVDGSGQREPALEAAYRRGFIEGADKAVTGLRRRLTDNDMRKLRAWMRELSKWRNPVGDARSPVPPFPELDFPVPADPRP